MSDPRPLNGRRALVTGATGGLGLALAEGLALAGADLILTGLEQTGDFEAQRVALESGHDVGVFYRTADFADPNAIRKVVDEAEREGGVDILVNNAVVRQFEPIDALAPEDWDRSLAVNLSAPFHTIRLLLPGMRKRGFGRIFNMSSVYGSRGTANRVGYVTTKAAIEGLTRAVSAETLAHDISCHALCPGSVLTPGTDERVVALMERDALSRPEAEAEFLRGKQPTGRFIDPAGVTHLMVLLCGPLGKDMTGSVLPIDGGWLAGQ